MSLPNALPINNYCLAQNSAFEVTWPPKLMVQKLIECRSTTFVMMDQLIASEIALLVRLRRFQLLLAQSCIYSTAFIQILSPLVSTSQVGFRIVSGLGRRPHLRLRRCRTLCYREMSRTRSEQLLRVFCVAFTAISLKSIKIARGSKRIRVGDHFKSKFYLVQILCFAENGPCEILL